MNKRRIRKLKSPCPACDGTGLVVYRRDLQTNFGTIETYLQTHCHKCNGTGTARQQKDSAA